LLDVEVRDVVVDVPDTVVDVLVPILEDAIVVGTVFRLVVRMVVLRVGGVFAVVARFVVVDLICVFALVLVICVVVVTVPISVCEVRVCAWDSLALVEVDFVVVLDCIDVVEVCATLDERF
jgi:hypothetical protein